MSDQWDGVDRRDQTSDLRVVLSSIGERLRSIEERFSIKVDHVCGDVEEIKSQEEKKHTELEKKIYQRMLVEFNKIGSKLEIIAQGNVGTNLSIQKLDNRIDILDKRLVVLENSGKDMVYGAWKKVGEKLFWVLLWLLGMAIMFALSNADFWSKILKG